MFVRCIGMYVCPDVGHDVDGFGKWRVVVCWLKIIIYFLARFRWFWWFRRFSFSQHRYLWALAVRRVARTIVQPSDLTLDVYRDVSFFVCFVWLYLCVLLVDFSLSFGGWRWYMFLVGWCFWAVELFSIESCITLCLTSWCIFSVWICAIVFAVEYNIALCECLVRNRHITPSCSSLLEVAGLVRGRSVPAAHRVCNVQILLHL